MRDTISRDIERKLKKNLGLFSAKIEISDPQKIYWKQPSFSRSLLHAFVLPRVAGIRWLLYLS